MNNRKEYLKNYRLNHKEKYREYQTKYRKNHLSTYEKLQQENQQYKEVIDKAIEWVYMVQQNKDNKHLEPIICTDELDELLDILKGSEINE